jgi:hypothetical protein
MFFELLLNILAILASITVVIAMIKQAYPVESYRYVRLSEAPKFRV